MRIPRRFNIDNRKDIIIFFLKVIVLVSLYIVASVYTVPVYTSVKTFVEDRFLVNTKIIVIGDTALTVEIADTYEKRELGLSGREALKKNTGMFFVFDEPDTYGFWMKDMKFNIDIIWLNVHGEIIYMKESVSPDTYPETFTPETEALYVLEVPAGFATEKHLEIGDKIDFY